MHPRTIAAGAALAFALAGCAEQHPPPPQPIKDFGWSLDRSPGEGAKLVYGQAGTDNVALMLTCRPGSGRIQVLLPGVAPAARGVALASGGKRLALLAKPPAKDADPEMFEAEAAAADPVMAAFAGGGELSLIEGRRGQPVPVRPAERGAIREFAAACRA